MNVFFKIASVSCYDHLGGREGGFGVGKVRVRSLIPRIMLHENALSFTAIVRLDVDKRL